MMRLSVLIILMLSLDMAACFSIKGSSRVRGTKLTAMNVNGEFAQLAQRVAATVLSGALLIATPDVSVAANYGGFGSKYAEVVDPKDGRLSETGMSEEAKSGLSSIKGYISAVESARSDLAKDSNAEMYNRLQKAFDPSTVRTSLNKFNSAFDEDTQRGTDRLIRLVLQDLTELDRETQVKPGKTRAQSKAVIVDKRLLATEDALKQLAAFSK